MSQLMLDRGLASRGLFILIGPRLNRRVDAAARLYAAELVDPSGAGLHHDGRARVGFDAITLEAVIEATAEAGAVELARKLWARYCDMDQMVQVALQGSSPPPALPSSPAAAPSAGPEHQSKPRTRKPRRPRIAPRKIGPIAAPAPAPRCTFQ